MSRLLSVFIALILLASGFLVASAHDGDYTARVTIVRTDSEDPVHPGTKLKFTVIIDRGGHDIPFGTQVGSVFTNTGTTKSAPDQAIGEDADDNLTESNPFKEFTGVTYTVDAEELGNAQTRTVPIQFVLTLDAAPTGHGTNATVMSNTVDVVVTKQPGAAADTHGVEFIYNGAPPDEIAVGKKVTLTLTAITTEYGLTAQTVVVSKQLYDADGEKGDSATIGVFRVDQLGTDATGQEEKIEYPLRKEDIEASKVVFSYSHEITDVRFETDGTTQVANSSDLLKADGMQADIFGDYSAKIEGSYEFMSMPEPEEEASPYIYMSDAAKVEEIGGGTAIVVTRLDTMSTITMTLGSLSGTGALLPRDSGYIRDESRGQTYAVVRRASDNMVVRVWISSASEWVSHVPWENVIAFYNVPADVLNVIPLDDTMPEVDQLVDVEGDYYVYRDRAWRHIPNLSTFRAEGFYWCDLTTADSSHAAASSTATPLPSKVGPPAEGYPACRGE